ncbi:MAG: glycosyltransferase family 39 protein [Pseudomonadota bacterium]
MFQTKPHPLWGEIFFFFFATIAIRYVTAEYLDIGGDNAQRWAFADSFLRSGSLSDMNHHTSRWAIMIPLTLLTWVLGFKPAVYSILPILASALGTVFIYLTGVRLGGPRLGVISAALLIVFPVMTQTGSQLWPSVFQFMFLSIAIYLLLLWHEKRHLNLLVAAALFCFCIWGSRITAVYLFPGIALLIWLPSKEFKPILIFFSILALLFLVEWVAFWYATGNTMGRIGLVAGSAIGNHESLSVQEYLIRIVEYKKLKGLLPVFVLSVIAAVVLIKNDDKLWRGLAAIYLIYIILLVYMVGSFSPIRPATWPSPRYWATVAPFGLLLMTKWLLDIGQRRPKVSGLILSLIFVAFVGFSVKNIPPTNSLTQMNADYEVLRPALAAGETIALHWAPWRPNFIEKRVFGLIGYKKANGVDKNDVKVFMIRARDRMLAMNLEDKRLVHEYRKTPMLPAGDLEYIYYPPGAEVGTKPTVDFYFDRKNAYAVRR